MPADEAKDRLRHHSLTDADYDGCSWDGGVSRYAAADADERRQRGQRYDRVCFRGAAWACAYLTGKIRWFHEGRDFVLSDHFAVMALVSVHTAHLERSGMAIVRELRAQLVRSRDREAVAERHVERQRSREGAARAVMVKLHKDDEALAKARAKQKRVDKAVRERRNDLRRRAFGKESLFTSEEYTSRRAEVEAPRVPGLGLFLGEGIRAQADAEPALRGFAGEACASCIASVCQVLLRTPAVRRWLGEHAASCDAVSDGDVRCVPCLMRGCAAALGRDSSSSVQALVRDAWSLPGTRPRS